MPIESKSPIIVAEQGRRVLAKGTFWRRQRIMANKRVVTFVHLGEILNEEFLKPLNISANALALALRVPSNRIYAIIDRQRSISADTALRLGRYFGMSAEFWINLQAHYDLETAKEESGQEIEEQLRPRSAA